MNEKVKKLWVKALRSGKYEQGKNQLRSLDNKYCCLGVLCDIYRKEHGKKWNKFKSEEGQGGIEAGYHFMGEPAILPYPVADWADLEANPSCTINYETYLLIVLNDGLDDKIEPKNFTEIANIIENSL